MYPNVPIVNADLKTVTVYTGNLKIYKKPDSNLLNDVFNQFINKIFASDVKEELIQIKDKLTTLRLAAFNNYDSKENYKIITSPHSARLLQSDFEKVNSVYVPYLHYTNGEAEFEFTTRKLVEHGTVTDFVYDNKGVEVKLGDKIVFDYNTDLTYLQATVCGLDNDNNTIGINMGYNNLTSIPAYKVKIVEFTD